jgi:hypothetical protein
MARAGVENAVAVVPASTAICCSLSTRGKSCQLVWPNAASESRVTLSSPQDYPSRLCSLARLLHMEARGEGLRSWQSYCPRYCTSSPPQFPQCQSLILESASCSWPCRYAARGSGSAQPGRCPIALRRPLPLSPSTIGLGIGQVQHVATPGTRVSRRLRTSTSARFQSTL